MPSKRHRSIPYRDLLAALLLLLPFLFLWPVTFGGKVLVPFDNLFTLPPWSSAATELGVSQPHNGLVSDLVLENYVWKRFVVESLRARQIPLWNPYLFAGVPFLAAGQHSALYPLSLLFYVLPISQAFGYFTALQLFLAGLLTYIYLRVLRAGRPAALLAGITFTFSLLVVANVVFPMIIAAMSWLPALLAVVESIVQPASVSGKTPDWSRMLPRLLIGSLVVGIQFLAGHIEISYYVLLVTGFYALWRLATLWRGGISLRRVVHLAVGLAAMVLLGIALAAVQLIPLYELASVSFRQGSASYKQVIGWSFPWRQLISFVLPDFFGNPTHHGYFDIVARSWVPVSRNFFGQSIDTVFWGRKNYVEAASYVGVLPLLLALLAVLREVMRTTLRAPHSADAPLIRQETNIAVIARSGFCDEAIPNRVGDCGNPGDCFAQTARNDRPMPCFLVAKVTAQVRRRNQVFSSKSSERGAHQPPSLSSTLSATEEKPGFFTTHPVWLFVVLAVVSLAFAFGTPLYAPLYYVLPGFSQLHTPFRWIFPYVFSMAVLAGLGADALWRGHTPPCSWRTLRQAQDTALVRRLLSPARLGDAGLRSSASKLVGVIALSLGLGGLLVLATSFLRPQPFVRLADRVLRSLGTAQWAFADGRMFLSYQFRNLLLFGIFLTASGLVLLVNQRSLRSAGSESHRARWSRWAQLTAIVLVVVDLWLIGHNFYPATDPALADYIPPAVAFLQAQEKPFRVTTYGDDQTLWPNTLMPYGIEDVRGYDSIIPKSYVNFISQVDDQRWLLYNRIGPLTSSAALDSPLLDLLNVEYVVTQSAFRREGLTLVYDDKVRIYRNEDALPRAFIVPWARQVEDRAELLQALEQTDLRSVVLLEEELPLAIPNPQSPIPNPQSPQITRYTPNEVLIDVALNQPAWLVLSDSYFPGWRAYVSTDGGEEQETPIYRADYNFRAVFLPQGEHRVRFKYSPMSFKAGLYVSFLAGIVILLGGGYWLWGRLYREEEGAIVQRVAKNSLLPMATSLLNKVIDFAFAMLMLRVLGPVLAGQYYFAIVIIGFLEIFTNFGLNLLLTREVAKDPSQANRYLSNTALLRLLLWAVSLPLLLLFLVTRQAISPLTGDTIRAIGLLMLALIPGNIAAALSSLFTAHERMEVPAAITALSTLLKVSLGALALLLGYGFIGLAGVSVVVNAVTAVIFYRLAASAFFRPRLEFDRAFNWQMVLTSYPLMLNHLLQTLFFKVDVVLLQSLKGDAVVGWYSTAYKWIDALFIIPGYFTMAIFPLMSRYAVSARESLLNAYVLALRLLVIIAVPIAVMTTFIADELITILGGAEYLPHGAIALQLMIWFLPFSFLNGVSQYVLIAIDEQRWITRSFIVVAAFNIAANLLFIPPFGYRAAAVITILSEFVLFVPFYHRIRQHLGPLPLPRILWRPLAAGGVILAVMWLLRSVSALLTVPLSGGVYLTALVLLGTFTDEDRTLLRRIWPRASAVPQL